MEANRRIKYYGTYQVCKDRLMILIENAMATVDKLNMFEEHIYDIPEVDELLTYLSSLPVFETDYSLSLQHDLDLRALSKKLKVMLTMKEGVTIVRKVNNMATFG